MDSSLHRESKSLGGICSIHVCVCVCVCVRTHTCVYAYGCVCACACLCLDSITMDMMFEEALGDSEGQGSLVYYSPWGCKESDMTEQLNNTPMFQPYTLLQRKN